MAYVYPRQSTMAQVYHHQESTQRQYALKDRALELGWPPDQIRVLDADLGQSGTQMNNRQDFKTLVADVSLEKVGLRVGSLALITLVQRLASLAGDLLFDRHPHRSLLFGMREGPS